MSDNYTNDLKKLAEWLQKHAPENVMMPLISESKRPIRAHKDGQWTWEAFYQHLHAFPQHREYAILMRSLFCMDFDNKDLFYHFQAEHPEWFEPGSFALARTSKGIHALWRRSPYCDEVPLHDKARPLEPTSVPPRFLDVHKEAPIDIKTLCSTNTASVLVVAPSRNKTWIRSPWSLPTLEDVPEALVHWILDNTKRQTRERMLKRKEGTISDPKLDGEWTIPQDEALCLAQAQHIVANGNVDAECKLRWAKLLPDPDAKFYKRCNNQFYFFTGPARHCPYREEAHDSNNFSLIFCQNGDITYWCFGSKCQGTYNEAKNHCRLEITVGRWFDVSLALDEPVFDYEKSNRLTEEWDKLMAKKEANRDIERMTIVKEDLMSYYNRFFVAVTSTKPEIIQLQYDKRDNISTYVRRKVEDAFKCYPSRFFRHVWWTSGKRKEVTKLVFKPDTAKVRTDEFNTFLGLRIEREHDINAVAFDPTRIKTILELLHDVWANGNDEVYQYLLNWFAYPLQKRKKTGVCLVVISDQGFGKGTIAHDLLGVNIYGENKDNQLGGAYAQITDIDDIVGKFNTMSCCHLYINADECSSFGGAYKQNNKFKSIIVAETRKMEAKGLDGIQIDDHSNFLLTTNADEPVRVETSDRRFVLLEIPPHAKKPVSFFKNLHKEIPSASVHFYKFLMERDLSNFDNPQQSRPITAAARELMAKNTPPVAAFLQACVVRESFALTEWGEYASWTQDLEISAEQLFDAFLIWVRKSNRTEIINNISFGSQLRKIYAFEKGTVTSGKKRGGVSYKLPAPGVIEVALKKVGKWNDNLC